MIAILRGIPEEYVDLTARALQLGGFRFIEVTLNSPGALRTIWIRLVDRAHHHSAFRRDWHGPWTDNDADSDTSGGRAAIRGSADVLHASSRRGRREMELDRIASWRSHIINDCRGIDLDYGLQYGGPLMLKQAALQLETLVRRALGGVGKGALLVADAEFIERGGAASAVIAALAPYFLNADEATREKINKFLQEHLLLSTLEYEEKVYRVTIELRRFMVHDLGVRLERIK